ncbi:M15 family metallopeptidase [Pseudomonas sp. Marseille-P9899]|uniref:M15 family metallopeptidase n=1 Tax=Pseudomonas sp. Marseille-P9899 TaxID=2730401 RepID=UPI001589887A|nr:M15 family metallopeptidase [Pseudomonas sp. Marseille-P9899]
MSKELCKELGISEDLLLARGFVAYPEARVLAIAEINADARRFELEPDAAAAWKQMKAEAAAAGVELWLMSAYRSVTYQANLIRTKLKRGLSLEQILAVNAPPGYSEHHTGRAIDINSLEIDFEHSRAYQWLSRHAQRFDFHLSYPRNNPLGYQFEPWHWCYGTTLLAVN